MYEIELRFTPGGDIGPDDFEDFLNSTMDELARFGAVVDYTAAEADLRANWTIEVRQHVAGT
jgi:hypothetical protein